MSPLHRRALVLLIALALAVPAVGSTAAQAERNDGATVDIIVEIVPPTEEPGAIIVSAHVEGPAAAGGRTFTHTFNFGISLPASRSGPTISLPPPICVPEAGTLCPP
jgi:hypothetical protein